MPNIRINSSAGPYNFACARGALANAASLLKRLGESTGTFVVSSPNVWRDWGKTLAATIPGGRKPILFDDAEELKRLSTVEAITRALVREGADRHSTIVAIGGGVVGDVVGFVAASYLRGVRLVHVPTTLVAQVDSSIGGKTGVNLPEGKNLVGAFYPPRLIIADANMLQTLPHREFRSGLYEVVKYGVIADPNLFGFLEKHMPAVLRRDPDALARIISRCAAIKADVVNKDEREGGLRQILNFGHTIGHGLEAATGYKRFLHGEAIGWGMITATLLAVAVDRLRSGDAVRMIRLVASIGPLPKLGKIRAAQLRPILAGDKKARGGRVLWVLPSRIGKTDWGIDVPWTVVARAFAETPTIAREAGI
ncbi:MAG TPA: 3-dehydroquinate synthase [Candidatus Acidoferrales bacterium]|jgi:3-dehydroquinate synthase|nr:3-dehydroquinate synthase [Candidatus Acidoferrales bacterium]